MMDFSKINIVLDDCDLQKLFLELSTPMIFLNYFPYGTMNYNKIRRFLHEQSISRQRSNLTDFKLVLKDTSREIILHLHKIILIISCKYFDRLFVFKDLNELTLEVSNVTVAKDVIMSFYQNRLNITNWSYALEIVKLQDYFGLESSIPNLKITNADFEIFLEVCGIVGFNEENLALIKQHMPEDYDMEKLSPDLIQELLKREDYYKIITGSWDHMIRTWSLDENMDMYSSPLKEKITDMKNEVYCLVMTNDNKYLLSGGYDYNIRMWDFETGTLIHVFKGHSASIQTLAITPNNKYLISGSWDETIKIWNLNNGSLYDTLWENDGTIHCVVAMWDNKRFISRGSNMTIKIWDIERATIVGTLQNDSNIKTNIALMHHNEYIVFGDNNRIKIWDLAKLSKVKILQDNSVAVTTKDLNIISLNEHSCIKIWDFTAGLLLKTIESKDFYPRYPYNTPRCLSLCVLESKIIKGNSYGIIEIWDLEEGTLIKTLGEHKNTISSIVAIRYESKWLKKLGLQMSRNA